MEEKMNNQNQTANAEETSSTQSSTSNETTGQNLVEELNRLGNKFAEVVQVAWKSEQRKKIEQDLRSGLSSLAANLEEGVKQVADSEQAKELLNKAEDVAGTVAEKVQKSKFAQELADNLINGLRALTEEIDKFAADLQSKNKSTNTPPTSSSGAQSSADQAQDIPIDKV